MSRHVFGLPAARSARRVGPWLLLALVTLWSCQTADTVTLLQIDASGVLFGVAFVDGNGNGTLDSGDRALKGAQVLLTSGTAEHVVQQVVTDSTGVFKILDVPVGLYRLALSTDVLGDSLEAVGLAAKDLTIERGDTTRIDFGVSYPYLSLPDVRALPPGRKVFTSGIALNTNVSFGDARLHIQSDTTYLRATNVSRASILAGDSVRLQGRTAVDNGQPVLDEVTPVVLVSAATLPSPVDVTTAEAAAAKGGSLDAGLVRVRTAEILDTATVDGDFRFHIDDGSGPVEVVLPAFLQLNTSSVIPDSIVQVSRVTGLLIPRLDGTGQVQWQLYPRGASDLVLVLKQLDVSVTMKVDQPVVTFGDMVKITVAVANSGPQKAVGVQIADTIPAGLALVSASATHGTYNAATHRWSVDTLAANRADTLTLTARVSTALPGTLVNRAYFLGLQGQADTNASNNSAGVGITVAASKQADVGVIMSVNPTKALVGDTVEFTINATNAGPFRATSVHIANALPTGLTFLDATATRGNYVAASGHWVIDTLQAGAATESLSLRATVDTIGAPVTVVDTAYSTGAQNEVDPNPANDTASVNLGISPTLPTKLSVEVSADRTTVTKGDTVVIKVLMRNAGPFNVTGVGAYDTLPSGLTLLKSTTSRGTYDPASGTWAVDSLKALRNDSLMLQVEVSTDQAGDIVDRAHLRGPESPAVDTDPGDNDAQVTVTVQAPTPVGMPAGAQLVLGTPARPATGYAGPWATGATGATRRSGVPRAGSYPGWSARRPARSPDSQGRAG